MSRSIGDVYLKKPEFNRDPIFQQFGNPIPLKRPVMTAEPSIIVRKLKPQDLFLIFASDGLWEQLSDEAAVDIVFKNPRAVSAHLSLIFYNFFPTVINSSWSDSKFFLLFPIAVPNMLNIQFNGSPWMLSKWFNYNLYGI